MKCGRRIERSTGQAEEVGGGAACERSLGGRGCDGLTPGIRIWADEGPRNWATRDGLLDTLTRALQSSGVDLSQANIPVSVQVDLGKNATAAAADTSGKVATTPKSSAQSINLREGHDHHQWLRSRNLH